VLAHGFGGQGDEEDLPLDVAQYAYQFFQAQFFIGLNYTS
jgi:hypothetical protein